VRRRRSDAFLRGSRFSQWRGYWAKRREQRDADSTDSNLHSVRKEQCEFRKSALDDQKIVECQFRNRLLTKVIIVPFHYSLSLHTLVARSSRYIASPSSAIKFDMIDRHRPYEGGECQGIVLRASKFQPLSESVFPLSRTPYTFSEII